VVTLTAITMAVNTPTAVEITLCRPVSPAIHRAAPGPLRIRIHPLTSTGAKSFQAWILAFSRECHQGTGVKMIEISRTARCP
jgi:hypothetical protein